MSIPMARSRAELAALRGLALGDEPSCECMVCDLPEGAEHGPVRWNLVLWFPGPYPKQGEADMLLCDHCKDDWVDGKWDPPFDNFIITQCTLV